MPLTNTAIRAAKPDNKPRKLTDGNGLYLLLNPSGSRWWRFDYRYQGKRKTLSMGVYPEVSLKLARERRDEARRLLANHIDPSTYRQAIKARWQAEVKDNFENIAREWYAKHNTRWVSSNAIRIKRLLERDLLPWLGKRSITAITPPELLTAIRRIESRGAVETAHRALRLCGKVFRYAIATGRAERDISQDLRGALSPTKTKHFSAMTEPIKVAQLLTTLEGYSGTFVVQCALKLAPLVFVRPGELRYAQWADIDLEAAEWRFIANKTRTPHIVPLAHQAIAIFRELHPLTEHGRYVFPSARSPSGDRPMSENAITAALRYLGISKEDMTGHGFRAMARTLLDEALGFRPDFIEHQLAHAVRGPLGRAYNRTSHLPERRQMMQAWADYLDRLKVSHSLK